MDNELVSVVVPTYNRGYCLEATLDSVFSQTHRALEVVLVDDGSSDDTRQIAARLQRREPRLRYFYQQNRGVSAARNTGLRNARGAYIALLDSDDTWMTWKLEVQLACLAALPNAGMIWTDMRALDAAGNIIHARYLRAMYHAYQWFDRERLFGESRTLREIMTPTPADLADVRVYFGDILSPMHMGNLIHTPTVLLRRSRLEKVGFFDESMRTGEDYDFHLRTCEEGEVALLDTPTIDYQCRRPDQLSGPLFSLEIAQNFLRTVEVAIKRNSSRITLPRYMLDVCIAGAHKWIGEAALQRNLRSLARRHLARSLARRVWQPRTATLLIAALLPQLVSRIGFSAVRHCKRLGM